MSRYAEGGRDRRRSADIRVTEKRRTREPSGRTTDRQIEVDVIKAPNITKRFNLTKDEKEYELQRGSIGVATRSRWTDVTGDVVTDYDRIKITPFAQTGASPVRAMPPKVPKRQVSLNTFDRPARPRYDRLDIEVEDDIAPKSAVVAKSPRIVYRNDDSGSEDSSDEGQYREVEVNEIFVPASDTNSSSVSSWARSVAASTQQHAPSVRSGRSVSSRHSVSAASSRSSRSGSSISAASAASSATSRSNTSSANSYSKIGKPGYTRIPKRMVKRTVLTDEMRLEYESEDEYYRVCRALAPDHIDEVIRRSEDRATQGAKRYLYPRIEEERVEDVEEQTYDQNEPKDFLAIRRTLYKGPCSETTVPVPRRRCSSPERPARIVVEGDRIVSSDPKNLTIVLKDARGGASPKSAVSSSSSSLSRATSVQPRRKMAVKDVEVVQDEYHHTRCRGHDHRVYDECGEIYYPSTPRAPPIRLIPTKRANMVEYRPTDEGGKEYVVADVCDEPKRKDSLCRPRSGWIRLQRDSRDGPRRESPGAIAFYMSTLA